MKCFLGCFSSSKHGKQRRLMNISPSDDHRDGIADALQLVVKIEQRVIEEPPVIVNPIFEPKEKLEEDLSGNGKKVTFGLNAEVHEVLSAEEVTNNVAENNEEEEGKKEEEEKPSNGSKSISDLISSNEASYPPSHRYQNNVKEEKNEDMDSLDGDSKNVSGGDGEILVQEESSESLFSLSIESRKQGGEVGEKEVSSPMPKCGFPLKPIWSDRDGQDMNRNPDVSSVLNPVENITQWRAVKARAGLMPLHHGKENINAEQDPGARIISEDPDLNVFLNNLKANADKKVVLDQGVAVDTSLSSWLVESSTTALSKGSGDSVGNSPSLTTNSPRNREDRPVLGELTVKEVNQVSASTTTPTKRRSTPIIGTIGSYWRHTGRTVDSDSGSSSGKENPSTARENVKDEGRKWDSTPFEARLDRACGRITTHV